MILISSSDHRVMLVAAGVLMSLRDDKRLDSECRKRIATVGDELLAVALKVNSEQKDQNNAD